MSRDGLRKEFPPEHIGTLPSTAKRPALSYVGHAAVTDRLLQEAPEWTYHLERIEVRGNFITEDNTRRFVADPNGLPHVVAVFGSMTIDGVTREEVGEVDAFTTYGDEMKKAISDFIRRGAMRFGVALDLWSKEDLSVGEAARDERSAEPSDSPTTRDVPGGTGATGKGIDPPGTSEDSPAASTATEGEGDEAREAAALVPPLVDPSPAGEPATDDEWRHASALGLTGTKAKAIAKGLGINVKQSYELTSAQLDMVLEAWKAKT